MSQATNKPPKSLQKAEHAAVAMPTVMFGFLLFDETTESTENTEGKQAGERSAPNSREAMARAVDVRLMQDLRDSSSRG
ncbi:MAG: hypothetical protein L0Y44_07390 [Phycisphaerales bacterium]|nr:hypothetical protein [Phycisphaerales bacterium]MCI0630462.1 hypothetical protein [Phycisphaerales bacterium]MCI0676130.1 hypothetical protein [Phycisphaerales bacterium]